VTPRQRHAIREKHLDECRSRAIAMMNLPLGQQAIEDGYYTEMFLWLYHEMVDGRTPTGVPAKLLDEWKLMGEFRRGRGFRKVG
jgi:hypothetical protein